MYDLQKRFSSCDKFSRIYIYFDKRNIIFIQIIYQQHNKCLT